MHDTNIFQHCRLLRSSTTRHSLVSRFQAITKKVQQCEQTFTESSENHHREQSSGNGRQPWKRNDHQAVNECDKEVPALFRLFGYCGYLQVSKAALGMPRALTSQQATTTQQAQPCPVLCSSHHLPSPRTDNQADRHCFLSD